MIQGSEEKRMEKKTRRKSYKGKGGRRKAKVVYSRLPPLNRIRVLLSCTAEVLQLGMSTETPC